MGVYVWGRYRDRLLDFFYRRGEFDELGYETEGHPVELKGEEDQRETVFNTRNYLPGRAGAGIHSRGHDEEDYSLGRERAQPHRTRPAIAHTGDGTKSGAAWAHRS